MSVFDVRTGVTDLIDVIRFADNHSEYGGAQASTITGGAGEGVIDIVEDDNDDFVRIRSVAHAEALIEALKKAIELKWLN